MWHSPETQRWFEATASASASRGSEIHQLKNLDDVVQLAFPGDHAHLTVHGSTVYEVCKRG